MYTNTSILKFLFDAKICRNTYAAETLNLGPVHTYRDIFENGGFFLHFAVAFTRKRRFGQPKMEVFENALQSGDFRKRWFRVYVWTGRKLRRDDRVKSVTMVKSNAGFVYIL